MSEKKIKVEAVVTEATKAAIKTIAQGMERSEGYVVRLALDTFIAQHASK